MRYFLGALALLFALSLAQAAAPATADTPIRFVLTFDDGPDGREEDNPTAQVLDALADNPVQPGIAAIFFVQPKRRDAATQARVDALLGREHAAGHLLALHDGSTRDHPNHRRLDDAALAASLDDGIAALKAVTERTPQLLRPPYWSFDQRTLSAYANRQLDVLLTDISANDGKVWGFHASPRRRSHIASSLAAVRERLEQGAMPVVEGVAPVVVTFHDTNDYTAGHMREYLQILVREAQAANLTLAQKPFYDDRQSLENAALARARDVAHRDDMVPKQWRWLRWILG